MKKLPFKFHVTAQADNAEPATISVRGIIGDYVDDYWNMTNTEEAVLNELNAIPAGKKINAYINTVGGRVDYCLGIFNALKTRAKDVTTINAGFACSSGSVLMLAGDRRICPDSSLVMIHRPSGGGEGDEDDMQNIVQQLKTCGQLMADIYAKALNITPAKALEMMKATTWMTGKQAVECGFATESGDDSMVDPDADENVSSEAGKKIIAGFNIPKNLQARFAVRASAENQPPTPQPQPKVKSMKKITAALVAAGLITASTEEQTEDSLLPQINAIVAENKRLKTDNEAHLTARKTRVTALLATAVTDKVITEARQTSLLALGTASAEGETEVIAQIGELRAAKTPPIARGAKPAKPGAGEGDEASQTEARLEEIQSELTKKNITAETRATLTAESLKLRGMDNLFKKPEPASRN